MLEDGRKCLRKLETILLMPDLRSSTQESGRGIPSLPAAPKRARNSALALCQCASIIFLS